MTTTLQLFAVGRVDSNRDIVIAPAQATGDCTQAGGCQCDAYTLGEMDADDRKPCQPLRHVFRLVCIEAYICGHRAAQAPSKLPPLQHWIDYGESLQEFQDARDDEDFWRHHC